jgi:hypothetical protein
MSRLNTKKLLRQCQAIKKKQDAPLTQQQIEVLPVQETKNMNGHELEQYLTQFLQTARAAEFQYNAAVEKEIFPNAATQDILHAIEFAPSTIIFHDLIETLNELRGMRRATKRELEVAQIFKVWADEHKTALNKLENVLGDIRKVLNRQPNDTYRFKTDIFPGKKDTYLVPDEKENEDED